MLRQGRPVAEVALYLPVEDQFAFGPVDQMLLGFRLRESLRSRQEDRRVRPPDCASASIGPDRDLARGGLQIMMGWACFTLNTLARVGRGGVRVRRRGLRGARAATIGGGRAAQSGADAGLLPVRGDDSGHRSLAGTGLPRPQ